MDAAYRAAAFLRGQAEANERVRAKSLNGNITDHMGSLASRARGDHNPNVVDHSGHWVVMETPTHMLYQDDNGACHVHHKPTKHTYPATHTAESILQGAQWAPDQPEPKK